MGVGGAGYSTKGAPSSFQHDSLNCRQIYEHIQGCPVCQQIFAGDDSQAQVHSQVPQKSYYSQQHPLADPNSGRQFMGAGVASDNEIKISPTVAFLVVVLIVILLVYMFRNMSRN